MLSPQVTFYCFEHTRIVYHYYQYNLLMCTAHFFGNNRIELDTSKRQNRVCANLMHSVTVETTNNKIHGTG